MDNEIFEKIINLINDYSDLDENLEKLPSMLSTEQSKINDLYHLLEIEKLNVSQSWYFVKELQEKLINRRKIKNAMAYGQSFKSYLTRLNNEDNRKIVIVEMHKNKKQKAREIKEDRFSEYTKEDLINLKILKEKGSEKNERNSKSESK